MTDTASTGDAPASATSADGRAAPSVTFSKITFSDGNSIALEPDDVVVFVGPNNAGKSAALRELEAYIGPQDSKTVIRATELRKIGSTDEVISFLEKHAQKRSPGGSLHYHGYRFNIPAGSVAQWWQSKLQSLRSLFCLRVAAETRVTDSNPAPAIAILQENPVHPIQLLFADITVEQRISGYFKRAFDQELIVFRVGGSQWPLLVGIQPPLRTGESMYSPEYNRRLLDKAKPLQEQGDGMRSFASVILHLLAQHTPTVLLLDEPEAFLHPPQARLLGEFIATEKPKRAQLFVATHSADVLQGLLSGASDHLRVVRIQRDGDVNRVKELDKARTKEIGADPLMKFSNVLSGIFYQRVIIGESDADCLFYSTILDIPAVRGELQPDVLFVHAGGKGRLAALAEALRALDVDVDIVADMDVLKDEFVLKRIVDALGGDWAEVEKHLIPLRTAIEQQKPWLNAPELAKGVGEILGKTPERGEFPEQLRREINEVFKKASPWDAVKDAGRAAVPPGEAIRHYEELQKLCKAVGFWIVPVGEMEGFCKSIGGHGPGWVQMVVESRDLATDPELEEARKFVREIWNPSLPPVRKPRADRGTAPGAVAYSEAVDTRLQD